MTARETRRRFSADDYHAMVRAGVLAAGERVELIEGEVVEMAPIGSRHAACVKRLNRWLSSALAGRAVIGVQDPIRLGEDSEPEPDLTVLRRRDDFYAARHPRSRDVLLLIEVAGASLPYDRQVKLPLYARWKIAEVWVVDLTAAAVDVYREPIGSEYAQRRRHRRSEPIVPLAFPDLAIDPAEIVGLQSSVEPDDQEEA